MQKNDLRSLRSTLAGSELAEFSTFSELAGDLSELAKRRNFRLSGLFALSCFGGVMALSLLFHVGVYSPDRE